MHTHIVGRIYKFTYTLYIKNILGENPRERRVNFIFSLKIKELLVEVEGLEPSSQKTATSALHV